MKRERDKDMKFSGRVDLVKANVKGCVKILSEGLLGPSRHNNGKR